MRSAIFGLFLIFNAVSPVHAALQSQTVDYSYAGKNFKGYLAWDDSIQGKRPGVLVVHEFWGLNEYAKSRADQLAKLGYVALAADLYGDGKVFAHPEDAKKMVVFFLNNVPEWVGRTQAALKVLQQDSRVDASKLAAIGYCLGGATVLQLAYSGADLDLAASFHGLLPTPEKTELIKAKLLIFHGGADPHVTAESLQQLKTKLEQGKINHKITVYPEVGHGFTVPGSEKKGMPGVGYNAEADRKSWEELTTALRAL